MEADKVKIGKVYLLKKITDYEGDWRSFPHEVRGHKYWVAKCIENNVGVRFEYLFTKGTKYGEFNTSKNWNNSVQCIVREATEKDINDIWVYGI